MNVMGIIFSNINNRHTFELTKELTIASIPIGGKYRLIDFTLSNMVNSNISNIGVVTKRNYQSLMNHLGSGKEWDLVRKNGGLVILPPFGTTHEFYHSRLESLKNIINYINQTKAEYVLLSDCYHIYNIDFREVFKFHLDVQADITCVYTRSNLKTNKEVNVLTLDDEERILEMNFFKENSNDTLISLDIWFMKKSLLQILLLDAINNNLRSFNRDILKRNLQNLRIYGYKFNGYVGPINSLESFYQVNMDLLNEKIRSELFNQKNRAIYTKVLDSAPTRYGSNCEVSNSIIADGCLIDGVVKNSIIFKGSIIKRNSEIVDSIIMHNNFIDSDVKLAKVVSDKGVKICYSKDQFSFNKEITYIKKDSIL